MIERAGPEKNDPVRESQQTEKADGKELVKVTRFINGKKTIVLVDPSELEVKPNAGKPKKPERKKSDDLMLPDNFEDVLEKSKVKKNGNRKGARYSSLMSPPGVKHTRAHNGKLGAAPEPPSLDESAGDFNVSMSALSLKGGNVGGYNGEESMSDIIVEDLRQSLSKLEFDMNEKEESAKKKKKNKSKKKKDTLTKTRRTATRSESPSRDVSPSPTRGIKPRFSSGSLALSLGSAATGDISCDDSFCFVLDDDDGIPNKNSAGVVPIQDIQIETNLPDVHKKVKDGKRIKKKTTKGKGTKKPSKKVAPAKKSSSSKKPSYDFKKEEERRKKVMEANQKRIKEIKKKLSKIDDEKKKEIAELKANFKAQKKDFKDRRHAETKEEDKKLKELHNSGKHMIEYLQNENQRLLDEAINMKNDIIVATKQRGVLKRAGTELETKRSSLASWVDKKAAKVEKKTKQIKNCETRYIPDTQRQLESSLHHCRVEYHIREMYKETIDRVVDAFQLHGTNPKITKEILKLVSQCQREIDAMDIVPMPEALEEWLLEEDDSDE